MKKTLTLILLVLSAGALTAQNNCPELLFKANTLYEKGDIKGAIDMASNCTHSENITDQWQAYHLLAMAYLANNQPKEARQNAEKMLEINPTYKPSSLKDPTDLIRLLNSIRVIPKFSLGLAATLGGNITYPQVTATYNGGDYQKTYASRTSWQAGMLFGYTLNEVISLHTGLVAANKRFDLSYALDDHNLEVEENITYMDVPLFARFYTPAYKKFRAFGDVGVYTGRLLSAHSHFARHNKNTGETHEVNNLDAQKRRNNWEYGSLFGLGALWDLGRVNLTLDAKYYVASFTNITQADKRYENPELYYGYYFLDDDVKLNNLSISLSVLYNVSFRVVKSK